MGAFELLPMTGVIKKLLVGGATLDELRDAARDQGMQTLLGSGAKLIEQGVTTIAEVMSSVYVL